MPRSAPPHLPPPASRRTATTPAQAPAPAPDDDGIRVEVAADAMQATLLVPAGAALPGSAILGRLRAAAVVSGILEHAVAQATMPAPEARRIVVAIGEAAVPPRHATIEMLVHFVMRRDDGAIVQPGGPNQAIEVAAGAAIARTVPRQAGRPGRDVRGQELAVARPLEVDIARICGDGVRVEASGARVVAERDGLVVRRRDGRIDLVPRIDIAGDLDRHWGGLATRLAVAITGDILGGAAVQCGGDLQVGGVIEDASVSVRGGLSCGGILAGRHQLRVRGDIAASHVAGRTIACRNLAVASDIRDATIHALGDVSARLVLASTIHCAGSFTCSQFGNHAGAGSQLFIGVNPRALGLHRLAVRELDAITREAAEAREQVKAATEATRSCGDPPERRRLAKDLRRSLSRFEACERRVAKCRKVIKNATLRAGNNPDATATITGVIHPGVEVHIGLEARHAVTKPMENVVFRLKHGKVAWDTKALPGSS